MIDYPISFFDSALSQLQEDEKRDLISNAIAHRGSQIEDFEEFIKSVRNPPKPKGLGDINLKEL